MTPAGGSSTDWDSSLVSGEVSVLNGDRCLREAAESLINQSLRDFEFVIIDDGSTDHSAPMLDSYQNEDARLKASLYVRTITVRLY